MGISIKKAQDEQISLPGALMDKLDLREGDEVKAIVEGHSLRLEKLDRFLLLRGVLADDDAFDRAIDLLEEGWRSWKPPLSA